MRRHLNCEAIFFLFHKRPCSEHIKRVDNLFFFLLTPMAIFCIQIRFWGPTMTCMFSYSYIIYFYSYAQPFEKYFCFWRYKQSLLLCHKCNKHGDEYSVARVASCSIILMFNIPQYIYNCTIYIRWESATIHYYHRNMVWFCRFFFSFSFWFCLNKNNCCRTIWLFRYTAT